MRGILRAAGWRPQSILLAVTFALLIVSGADRLCAQEATASAENAARIDRLIQQLGDDNFQVREKAEQDLGTIGEPAIEKLTAASKDSSFERRERATKLLKEIRGSRANLRHVATTQHEGLAGAVTVTLSPDGNFVYVPGWRASAVNVFRRDAVSGMLEHKSTLADPAQLGGAVTLRLSPDGKNAVAACFTAQTITLLSRDEKTGELKIESVARSEPGGELQMQFPIDAAFSSDGKYVYAVDDAAGSVIVFRLEEGKRLAHVQTLVGPDGCFQGARGVTPHPDGKTLYISASRAGALSVLDRDPASGKISVRQVLRDGQDDVRGLAGTMGACVSRDGKFVYTASGRFFGDDAVGVFEVGGDGKLTVLQEFLNDQGPLENFTGGNELALSPDGAFFYASGTTSSGLACFHRNAGTGKLDFITTIRNETTGLGAELGANGIACSPDGRFIYLALEDAAAISVFERAAPTPR